MQDSVAKRAQNVALEQELKILGRLAHCMHNLARQFKLGSILSSLLV